MKLNTDANTLYMELIQKRVQILVKTTKTPNNKLDFYFYN